MGTLATSSRPCGYENRPLLVGGGKLTFFEHCAAPALCEPRCGELTMAFNDVGCFD